MSGHLYFFAQQGRRQRWYNAIPPIRLTPKGYDIPAGQVWVVDRPNLIQGGSLASGSKYAAVMFRAAGKMGIPALRSVLAGNKINPAAAIPPACDYLVDKAYFDSIFIRSPGLAKFAYVWWGRGGIIKIVEGSYIPCCSSRARAMVNCQSLPSDPIRT